MTNNNGHLVVPVCGVGLCAAASSTTSSSSPPTSHRTAPAAGTRNVCLPLCLLRLRLLLCLLQVVHTLTGHGDAVSCVACSPLQEATAVSTGEDRCIKVGEGGWVIV